MQAAVTSTISGQVAVPIRAPATALRLAAVDQMRGLVMVLMALDHSSEAFNAGRTFTDATFLYRPGMPLPAAQFFTRWITHLCAPTFLFLAGVGLAFTVKRKLAGGESPWAVDRYLAIRGLLIAGFELWISLFLAPPRTWVLQVLYAIGTSFVLMIPLRRLPPRAAAALAVLLIVGGELLTDFCAGNSPSTTPMVLALLVVGGERGPIIIGYPTLHWLAILLLGWVCGNGVAGKELAPQRITRCLTWAGSFSLLAFVLVRGMNRYGNMHLSREDSTLVQWLHVSKYPPSFSYTALELGIMALLLAALFAMSRRRPPRSGSILLTLGQTPMFFYLLHFPLLIGSAWVFGVEHKLGLVAAYAGAAAAVVALYPACRWYRRYKAAHRDGWPQYI